MLKTLRACVFGGFGTSGLRYFQIDSALQKAASKAGLHKRRLGCRFETECPIPDGSGILCCPFLAAKIERTAGLASKKMLDWGLAWA